MDMQQIKQDIRTHEHERDIHIEKIKQLKNLLQSICPHNNVQIEREFLTYAICCDCKMAGVFGSERYKILMKDRCIKYGDYIYTEDDMKK